MEIVCVSSAAEWHNWAATCPTRPAVTLPAAMASAKRGGFFARLGCGCGTATPPRVLSPIQNRAAGAPELHAPRAAAKATRALSFDEPQGEVTDEGVTEHEAPLEGVQQQEEAAEAAAGIAADTEAAAKALDADAEDAEEDKGATMSHFNHTADDNTPDEADVAVMEACEAQEAADALVDDSDAEVRCDGKEREADRRLRTPRDRRSPASLSQPRAGAKGRALHARQGHGWWRDRESIAHRNGNVGPRLAGIDAGYGWTGTCLRASVADALGKSAARAK